jgi:glutathione S-transferase
MEGRPKKYQNLAELLRTRTVPTSRLLTETERTTSSIELSQTQMFQLRLRVLLLLTTFCSSLSFSVSTMAPSVKLTYFDIEGAAEPVRLALVLSGTPFEDERVAFPEWAALKPTTPYGQLPLLTVDEKLYTQSKAMLRWVGSTCSETLYPADKLLEVEEAIGLLEDMTAAWTPSFYMGMAPTKYGYPAEYSKTEEGLKKIMEMRSAFVEKQMPMYLTYFENLLAKHDGKWLVAGDEPTIADCLTVATLRNFSRGHIDGVPTTCLDTHPKVVEYIKNFCALKPIQGRYTNGIF